MWQHYYRESQPATLSMISFISVVFSLLVACSGGGGSNGGSDLSPTLSNVTVTPDRAAAGLTVTFSGNFSFTDTDGDLNGGSFNYTYEGTTYSSLLPAQLGGMTSGTAIFTQIATLSLNTGAIDIPCWLVDNAGHSSNVVHVTITQTWTRQFGTALDDIGYGVAIDGTNNVIVSGTTFGNLDGETNHGVSDVFVTKYAPGTTRAWTRLLGSSTTDDGRGAAVDGSSNIYVIGSTAGTSFDGLVSDGSGDGFLIKFDTAGNRVWTRLISTTVTSDSANAVAVDASNNIYVAGETSGDLNGQTHNFGRDASLVKYDVDGNLLWTRLLGTTGEDIAYGVATDNSGNVYVTGSTDGVLGVDPSPGDPLVNADVFVAKYDTNGTLQWITQLGTPCSEWAKGITVDASNHVYIGGKIYQCAFPGNTASDGYDAFVALLDSNGNTQWIRQFGTTNHDSVNSITADGSGSAYVTGYLDSVNFNGILEGHAIFLAKYDVSGNQIWLTQDSAGSSWGNQGLSVVSDSTDNIFLTGTLQGQLDGHANAGGNDVFILKYDASGLRR